MTIGDIQDSLERIARLKADIARIWENREEYLHPDEKVED